MPQTLLMLLVYLSIDPFADATKGDDRLPGGTDEYIHIRIQQRNGRKTLTTVQGIADGYEKEASQGLQEGCHLSHSKIMHI